MYLFIYCHEGINIIALCDLKYQKLAILMKWLNLGTRPSQTKNDPPHEILLN